MPLMSYETPNHTLKLVTKSLLAPKSTNRSMERVENMKVDLSR